MGAAAIFNRRAGGRELRFEPGSEPGTFRDLQTGSTWEMNGRAVAGPLRGERLAQLNSDDQFWFALAAFYPEARIWR